MPVETFRGYVATLVSAIVILGGMAILAWIQLNPIILADGTFWEPDTGLLETIILAALGLLFLIEKGSQTAHASERAFEAGRHSQLPPEPPANAPTVYTEADAARHMEDSQEHIVPTSWERDANGRVIVPTER